MNTLDDMGMSNLSELFLFWKWTNPLIIPSANLKK